MWLLENRYRKGERISRVFSSRKDAEHQLERLGPIISGHYRVVYESGDPTVDRMLTEGLVRGDLENILLPRVSIDEYVPADPDTDNVVVAFFIKGEPKATIPLKNFVEHSSGVLSTDYGDSETIVNTQIVYAEFDRENLELDDIHGLMVQIAMLSGLEVDDFTMTFPHTNKKFPYEINLMGRYFRTRNERKNREAQKRAEIERQKKIDKELQKLHQQDQEQPSEPEQAQNQGTEQREPQTPAEALGEMPVKESLINRLAQLPIV